LLRDRFYDSRFAASVTEEEARELYNREIASAKPEEEIRARHILLLTEQQSARTARAHPRRHGRFATVAMEVSQDPGNAADGGDLGYFTRGQFDPGFEDAAAILERGVLSEPVQTKFGWHLILVEDKRTRPIPSFDELKGSIISLLIQRRALEQVSDLRGKAKIDIRDAEAAGPPTANPSPR
jgi:peptidyl-prolyl cis-trans isomerase C